MSSTSVISSVQGIAETAVLMSETFSILQSFKGLYDNLGGNRNKCKELIDLCSSLKNSLEALEKSSVEVDAFSLLKLKESIENCLNYCNKYEGKKWFFNYFLCKDEFDELKSRLETTSHSFQLDLSVRVRITQKEIIENDRKDKEEMCRLINEYIVCYNIQAKNADELNEKLIESAKQGLEIVEAVDDLDTSSPMFSADANGKCLLETLDINFLSWSESMCLGKGGSGEVFKGLYKKKDCAVKQLCFASDPTPKELSKIKKEARVAALLKHKNLIEFFGCSMNNKILVFELAACSVYDVLYKKKELTLSRGDISTVETLDNFDTVLLLFKDMLSGIMFLHSHGIIHRDIKPSNILLFHTKQNEKGFICKISDFGMATGDTLTSIASLTKSNRAVGSDPYLAPELLDFDGKPPYSFASDMYALGITINEILTRAPPFSDYKISQIGIQVVTKRNRPTLFNPDQTKAEERLLSGLLGNNESGLLHQDPNRRHTALSCLAPLQEDRVTLLHMENLMSMLIKRGILVNDTAEEESEKAVIDYNQLKLYKARASARFLKITADVLFHFIKHLFSIIKALGNACYQFFGHVFTIIKHFFFQVLLETESKVSTDKLERLKNKIPLGDAFNALKYSANDLARTQSASNFQQLNRHESISKLNFIENNKITIRKDEIMDIIIKISGEIIPGKLNSILIERTSSDNVEESPYIKNFSSHTAAENFQNLFFDVLEAYFGHDQNRQNLCEYNRLSGQFITGKLLNPSNLDDLINKYLNEIINNKTIYIRTLIGYPLSNNFPHLTCSFTYTKIKENDDEVERYFSVLGLACPFESFKQYFNYIYSIKPVIPAYLNIADVEKPYDRNRRYKKHLLKNIVSSDVIYFINYRRAMGNPNAKGPRAFVVNRIPDVTDSSYEYRYTWYLEDDDVKSKLTYVNYDSAEDIKFSEKILYTKDGNSGTEYAATENDKDEIVFEV